MARRQRVPRIKGHRSKRNKNPKLSPYQRELRRTKLANQAPIIKKNERDCSISQRALSQYLAERYEREQLRKQRRREKEEKAAAAPPDGEPAVVGAVVVDDAPSVPLSASDHPSEEKKQDKKSKSTKRSAKKDDTHKVKGKTASTVGCSRRAPVPLNEQIAASLSRPVLAFRTRTGTDTEDNRDDSAESIISRKKERKHRKKVEARRERVRAKLQEMERKLVDEVLSAKTSKKRKRANPVDMKDLAYEKMLRKMQKEKAESEAAEKRIAGKAAKNGNKGEAGDGRKHVTFEVDAGAGDKPHRPMRYPKDKGEDRPRDFYELVDVVRYGERVEGPPVFDAVPNRDTAITRLANQLHRSSQGPVKGGLKGQQAERLRLLSSVGGIGEQKRLERLGLVPSDNSNKMTATQQKLSKEEEMERLRMSVVEAYRRRKRAATQARNGTDMLHQFPLLA